MGIQGLIPFLKKASRHTNIRQFHGCTVAIDAYCWLHKGAFSVALKLAKGEQTDGYVVYCIKMVNMLLAAGVTPIMVFDGQNLPSKQVTEHKRHENRAKYKQIGKLHLIEGRVAEATECFQKCAEVTSQMARDLIKACRKLGVDCLVAPYEADAQLAYLNRCKIADIIITEDSDLVLFGCDRVLFKMDMAGNGVMFDSSQLPSCLGLNAESFTFDKFRHMCILSGCDYLPNLPGIGLVKACRFFSKTTNPNLAMILPKVPSYLNMPNLSVSKEYIEKFVRANNTFLHQLVFDPLLRKVMPLTPYPPDLDPGTLDYAGPFLTDETAFHIALGNIDVCTRKKVDNYDPDSSPVIVKSVSWNVKLNRRSVSIWSRDYRTSKIALPSESDECSTQTPSSDVRLEASPTPKKVAANRRISTKRIFTKLDREGEQPENDDLLSIYKLNDANKKVKCVETPEARSTMPGGPLVSTENKLTPERQAISTKTTVKTVVRSRFFVPKTPENSAGGMPIATSHQPKSGVSKSEGPAAAGDHLSLSDTDDEENPIPAPGDQTPSATPSHGGRLFFDRAFAARPTTDILSPRHSTTTSKVSGDYFSPRDRPNEPIGFTRLKENLQKFKFGNSSSHVNNPFKPATVRKPSSILEGLSKFELTSSGSTETSSSPGRSSPLSEGEHVLTPPGGDHSTFQSPLSTPKSSSMDTDRLAQLRRCLDEDEGLSEEENSGIARPANSVALKSGSFLGRTPGNMTASRCRRQGLSSKKKTSTSSDRQATLKGQLSIKESLAKFCFVKERLL